MLYRFKNFVSETFEPRNVDSRDKSMDEIVKQKEISGEVYIDFREYPMFLITPDNGKLSTVGSIVKRNPWSAGLQIKKDGKNLYEFAFYLHPVFADAKKKNLYEPYKLDEVEVLGCGKKFAGHKILLDGNVHKLLSNMCKLIYDGYPNGVKNASDLTQQVIEAAISKNILIKR
jgi:hypothetical protein